MKVGMKEIGRGRVKIVGKRQCRGEEGNEGEKKGRK